MPRVQNLFLRQKVTARERKIKLKNDARREALAGKHSEQRMPQKENANQKNTNKRVKIKDHNQRYQTTDPKPKIHKKS